MDFDRQSIERRDIPIGRRGYDPAAVDAHLKSLAAAFESVQRSRAGTGDASLASAAGNQVQSILEAAEAAAGEIERAALEQARQVREAADRDAQRTREEALEKARGHVASVSQATAGLLDRVGSMNNEVGGLIESLRAGAGRLAADLLAVEGGMGELYGTAGSGAPAPAPPAPAPAQPQQQTQQKPAPKFEAELDAAMAAPAKAQASKKAPAPQAAAAAEPDGDEAGNADVDGARLIALNMALNGESRSETERYLAENFELPDRLQLIDEVYAAIEG